MKGNLFIRWPKGKIKALTFSYDDGVTDDMRLAEIFKKNNLKATFNLNGSFIKNVDNTGHRERMSAKQCLNTYDPALFEVACHGFTHPYLDRCDPALALNQAISDRLRLEELFGREIHGMAYPVGTYNDEVVEILKTAGIYYSRTIKSHTEFKLPENWLIWHPTCHHNNPDLMKLADEFLAAKTLKRDPLLFYVWGHAYEFDDDDNWEVIESFCDKMARHDDIWYATNMEIYLYCRAFSRLEYSADGMLVYNPTSTEIWFSDLGNKLYCIKPGETVDFNENRGA